MNERGLDCDGTVAREGALDRVPAAFVPVVDAARACITEAFGRTRLHSAYLYGSIPRGTATPGVSDLDLQLALHDEPTEADRADAGEPLGKKIGVVDGARPLRAMIRQSAVSSNPAQSASGPRSFRASWISSPPDRRTI
jgi:predicted nucleotidyltransferase